jgi:hypothetical protein
MTILISKSVLIRILGSSWLSWSHQISDGHLNPCQGSMIILTRSFSPGMKTPPPHPPLTHTLHLDAETELCNKSETHKVLVTTMFISRVILILNPSYMALSGATIIEWVITTIYKPQVRAGAVAMVFRRRTWVIWINASNPTLKQMKVEWWVFVLLKRGAVSLLSELVLVRMMFPLLRLDL